MLGKLRRHAQQKIKIDTEEDNRGSTKHGDLQLMRPPKLSHHATYTIGR
jgi:hypothetical protein